MAAYRLGLLRPTPSERDNEMGVQLAYSNENDLKPHPDYDIRNIRYEISRKEVTGCLYRNDQLISYASLENLLKIINPLVEARDKPFYG